METITEEKIEIVPELLDQINTQEEKQVIVHGIVKGFSNGESLVRVWPTICLIPKGSSQKCKLVHHFNIVLYPQVQLLKPKETLRFTLIFEGLPSDCKVFDVVEIIPEHGGFETRNIKRNEQDVYQVEY
jgi:hypothetical protein